MVVYNLALIIHPLPLWMVQNCCLHLHHLTKVVSTGEVGERENITDVHSRVGSTGLMYAGEVREQVKRTQERWENMPHVHRRGKRTGRMYTGDIQEG